MSKKQKVLVQRGLYIFVLCVFLFIVIGVPCITQLGWKGNTLYLENGEVNKYTNLGSATIAIMVLIPILVSVIAFICADTYFKVFTIEQAKAQYDKHLSSGLIGVDKWGEMIAYIEEYDIQKAKQLQEIANKRKQAEIEAAKQREIAKKKAMEELKDITQNA